ncbi:hypothetical protein P152DRAFT_455708 [Eremomyces bilateralis CBS 781.70]|uniref:Small ribosomal subunit protein mS41 n=1 Tax=Eremomyces bilateralis CBS 781.70 TaxID=1392243 RepID=A0A6G1GDJ4_9PEZI|nr:uncharacterized protein P152DRAFT_455708 [Eremomyces bilateralis CBS 781.70]KAF1815986.1 hypothetical protein P152DRAFT_455708 [Eremomyces bilateralis CBS 781.70]
MSWMFGSKFRPLKQACAICIRHSSTSNRLLSRPIPPPTPFVPDVATFLKVIGRNLSAHSSRIPSWDALFTYSSSQLRASGIEPARKRKYLLWWRERFRQGRYGVGGDSKWVGEDGEAHLRVFEVPMPPEWQSKDSALATATRTAGMRKIAVNVPFGTADQDTCPVPLEEAPPVALTKVRGAHTISGPFVEPLKGTQGMGARLKVQEGLWEVKQGRKVDGGERRKAEVRAKRRAAERKAAGR